jgi:GNAT superfamily N-acetyltransferase
VEFDDFDLSLRGATGTAILDAVERDLWLDLWRAPVLDAVAEQGIETRWYGPLQATVVAALPETPLLNLLLGAAEPDAVAEGHLAQALEWIDSLGLDCRVPIDPERPEAAAAEELLNQWGYERTETQVRFTRNASAPDFPAPAGIEVIELEEFTEGFSEFLSDGYELSLEAGMFFDCLPGRYPWRCYVALDEREYPCAAAATMLHWEAATHLGFAATAESDRGRGCHTALLHRCILDAAERSPTLFAETCEPLGHRDGPSTGCRNLLRAGFSQASVRQTWRPQRG